MNCYRIVEIIYDAPIMEQLAELFEDGGREGTGAVALRSCAARDEVPEFVRHI